MKKFIITFALVLTILLSGCTRQVGWVGLNYGNIFDVSYHFFDGIKIEKIQANAGDTFNLTYDIEVDDGALRLELLDPDRELVWEASFLEDNEEALTFQVEKSGRYTLRIIGDQTKGGFELRWDIKD
jgi:major membrane immunogen (membrane-anchored lipoprotein)